MSEHDKPHLVSHDTVSVTLCECHCPACLDPWGPGCICPECEHPALHEDDEP